MNDIIILLLIIVICIQWKAYIDWRQILYPGP